MGLYDFSFYNLIERNAVSFAQRPAWFEVDDGSTLTFEQFKQKVDALARGLQQAGLNKGDRIGVLGKNSLAYFLLYGAAAALGAIVLPVNWRLSLDEVAYNLADGAPRMVFVYNEFQQLIEACQERLPSVMHYFSLQSASGRFQAFDGLSRASGDLALAEVASDDGFVIIHTAAVAGRPRGALLSHGNLLCADLHLNYYFGLTCSDVHLNLLPMFHVGGLFMATNAFHAGALNVNMSKFEARTAVDLIAEHKVSLMFDFSPILGSILERQAQSGQEIGSLKAVIGLEAPATIEKYQQVTGGTFYCMYGQTETSCLASVGRYNDQPGSAGRVIPLGLVRLVDDDDRPVPVGQTGEITLKGPMVFKG